MYIHNLHVLMLTENTSVQLKENNYIQGVIPNKNVALFCFYYLSKC